MENLIKMFKSKEVLKGESLSAFGIANARSLGLLGAYMANKGTFRDKQLISEDTWSKFHSEPKDENMDGYWPNTFTKGGACIFGLQNGKVLERAQPWSKQMIINGNELREGWIGWMGYGGSVFQYHPDEKIGFGYVPFNFLDIDSLNKRGAQLQNIVMQCVKKTYVSPEVDRGCLTCNIF